MNRKIFGFLFVFFFIFPFFTLCCASPVPLVNAQTGNVPGFPCYRNLETIYQTAIQLQTKYPNLATLTDIGDSWQKQFSDGGFDLFALKITDLSIPSPKPNLFLVSGLRGNAFAPMEINLRFAEFLLNSQETDDSLRYLLEHFAVHFIFVANPDGRARAESQADGTGSPVGITWTKNLNPSGCSNDNGGVSLERNFVYQWQNEPTDPCSAVFPGTEANSEPETQAMVSYLQTQSASNPFGSFLIDLESYQNYLITPYLYSKTHLVSNYEEHQILANKILYDTQAEPLMGNSQFFLAQHGTLVDFAHAELGMTALLYRIGSEMGGGDVSNCAYFKNSISQPAMQSLLRALNGLPDPLQYAAGPEIHALHVNYDSGQKTFTITGEVDSISYYKYQNRPSFIDSVFVSFNLPPWHPQAVLIRVEQVEIDPEIPGQVVFSFTLDADQIPTEGLTLYFQGQANDPARRNKIDSGFVHPVKIRPYFNMYFPLLAHGAS